MSEKNIQNDIQINFNNGDIRLFRNSVGRIQGKDGRFHVFGLCNGSSDLIGFKTITIRQEHVGKKVAVFAAVECKAPKGKPTTEQLNFIDYILKSGGLAGIARSTEDAKSILNEL